MRMRVLRANTYIDYEVDFDKLLINGVYCKDVEVIKKELPGKHGANLIIQQSYLNKILKEKS